MKRFVNFLGNAGVVPLGAPGHKMKMTVHIRRYISACLIFHISKTLHGVSSNSMDDNNICVLFGKTFFLYRFVCPGSEVAEWKMDNS